MALQHTSGTNQEKGHSASLLSHAQPEQEGLDKQFSGVKYYLPDHTYVGALNNCLIEMVLLSTHNKYFDREVRKLILCYALLTKCLNAGHIGRSFCLFVSFNSTFFQLYPDGSSLVEPLLIKD